MLRTKVALAGVLPFLALFLAATSAGAQTVEHRGFVEAQVFGFGQQAPNDSERLVEDVLVREELFIDPTRWLRLEAGLDLRANSHGQVDDSWELNGDDRGLLRPRLAVRRLLASTQVGPLAVDVGKQFIRWGRTDILNPTDRFAPKDFLNVIDTELLPVLAVRPLLELGSETFEFVWSPRMTPSRVPLLDQRWTVLPPEAEGLLVVDRGSQVPEGSQYGARWRHAGRFDAGLSVFSGFNHLPSVDARVLVKERAALELTRIFSELRTYGGELAIPVPWFVVKGEAAYFQSPSATNEEYVLYVVEIERQVGEWVIAGGYAGEVVTNERPELLFSPERGVARSIVAHAGYTLDPRQSVAIEGALRQDGSGVYAKAEYSRTFGQHWRLTITGVGITGDDDDFLGQFRRNSHGSAALRFSF